MPEPLLNKWFQICFIRTFKGTISYDEINESNVILVTVGTSLSVDYDSDLSALENVFKNLMSKVVKDQLIMIKKYTPGFLTRKLSIII